MASKSSRAASIRNKHTVESDLWSSAQNERSSGDLKASNHQLIPYGCCRLLSTVTVFIVCEEAISDGISTLTCRKKPYFLSAWRIATCSVIHSGSQQILAVFNQMLPVDTLVTQRRAFSLRLYDSFLMFFFSLHVPAGSAVEALLQGKGSCFTERLNLPWLKSQCTRL